MLFFIFKKLKTISSTLILIAMEVQITSFMVKVYIYISPLSLSMYCSQKI